MAVFTDAGYAGVETRSQTGIIVIFAGTIITWRSSLQSVSTLSTCEAEVAAAALGWTILEGLRQLFADWSIDVGRIKVWIDNKAALTIALCGSSWRTRYFGVRGNRLNQEHYRGGCELLHCPTKDMVADCLTKLATAPVIEHLHAIMEGAIPTVTPKNAVDHDPTAGDAHIGEASHPGPPQPIELRHGDINNRTCDVLFPLLPVGHADWRNVMAHLYDWFSPNDAEVPT